MTGSSSSRLATAEPQCADAERNEFPRAPLVQFFERRVGNLAEAEDLAQEVFERLARQSDLGRLEQLDGYVFTVATNLLRDRARKRVKHAADAHVSLDHIAEFSEEITPVR